MSQTQTTSVALATTVSNQQLSLLFCILPLPPAFFFSSAPQQQSFLFYLFRTLSVISLYCLQFALFFPYVQSDLVPIHRFILYVVAFSFKPDDFTLPHHWPPDPSPQDNYCCAKPKITDCSVECSKTVVIATILRSNHHSHDTVTFSVYNCSACDDCMKANVITT